MRRLASLLAWRKVKLDPSQRREARMDAIIQIAPCCLARSAERVLQDVTRLGLHGMATLSGAHAQSLLDRGIKVSDGDAAHVLVTSLRACNVINDCIDVKAADGP